MIIEYLSSMASQIAHVVYATKYFEKYPLPNGEREEFILGSLFPDIRRIDETIQRKDTHLRFEPLDLNFEGLDPFQSGWKFHLYCDMRREEILNNHNFYLLKNTADFWHLSSKIFEDEIIYDDCDNWEKLVHYFNNVPDIDVGTDVSRETFELWYAIIAKYVETKPCSHSMKIFLSKQKNLASIAKDILVSVNKLRKNAKVIEILKKVKEEIV